MNEYRLGWIGCGDMGVRMAMRLIDAGYSLNVYNRTAAKAKCLTDTGKATLAGSPAQVAALSDIIFISVTNDQAVSEVLDGEQGLLSGARPGQIIAEMSTLSPAFSHSLRERLKEKGIMYLDAPVIGSMYMIEAGLLKILVSSERKAYETVLPYFNAIGRSVIYMGEDVQARHMKIAVNMMICSYLTIYGEVLCAGEATGFGWDELNDSLESCGGASPMLSDKGTTLRERIWKSSAALTSTALKDLGLALDVAKDAGFSLPLTAVICQYDRFMHYHQKYNTYSTFGTIGMLEDITGKTAGDYPPVPEEKREEYMKALELALTGITSLQALEAVKLCREAGIDMEAAVQLLGNCHGASVYFKEKYPDLLGQDTVAAIEKVLTLTKDKGVFLPIIATANEAVKCFLPGQTPQGS